VGVNVLHEDLNVVKKMTFSISLDYLNDLQNEGKKILANCPMTKSHSFNTKTCVPKN